MPVGLGEVQPPIQVAEQDVASREERKVNGGAALWVGIQGRKDRK